MLTELEYRKPLQVRKVPQKAVEQSSWGQGKEERIFWCLIMWLVASTSNWLLAAGTPCHYPDVIKCPFSKFSLCSDVNTRNQSTKNCLQGSSGAQMWNWTFFLEVNITPLWERSEMLANPEAFWWAVLNNLCAGCVSVEQLSFPWKEWNKTQLHPQIQAFKWLRFTNNTTLHSQIKNSVLQILLIHLFWNPQWNMLLKNIY